MSKKLDQIGGAIFIVLCIIAVIVSILALIYFMPDGSSDDTSEEPIETVVMDRADSAGDISTKNEKTVEASTPPDNKEIEPQQPSASVENDSESEKDVYDERCPEDLSYVAWYYGEGIYNHDEALVIENSDGSFYMPRSSNYEEWFTNHVDNCPYAFHDGPDYGIPDWLYKQLIDSKSDDIV